MTSCVRAREYSTVYHKYMRTCRFACRNMSTSSGAPGRSITEMPNELTKDIDISAPIGKRVRSTSTQRVLRLRESEWNWSGRGVYFPSLSSCHR